MDLNCWLVSVCFQLARETSWTETLIIEVLYQVKMSETHWFQAPPLLLCCIEINIKTMAGLNYKENIFKTVKTQNENLALWCQMWVCCNVSVYWCECVVMWVCSDVSVY